MATETPRNAPAGATPEAPTGPKIRWDDSQMHSSYANVCNAASSREEVVLVFGINQAWQAGQSEIPIQLTNRVIIRPYVARRPSTLLENVLKEHETRFGKLG